MPGDQLPLFDFGVDIAELQAERERLMRAQRAPNTRKVYNQSWRHFVAWCENAGRVPLPATPEIVALYVTYSLMKEKRRVSTIDVRLAAIATRHKAKGFASPCDLSVRALVVNARRELRERPRGKAAITVDQLLEMSRVLSRDPGLKATRDRAVILFGFAVGWRREELASLESSDVSFRKDGLHATLWKSKTDQAGKGLAVLVPHGKRAITCPVRALERWMDVRGRWKGPLFTRIIHNRHNGQEHVQREAISGATILNIVKDALERIGEDPTLYGAHSLRAGMATAAAEAGSPEIAIMRRVGWKAVSTMLKYVRPAQAFKADPLKGVL